MPGSLGSLISTSPTRGPRPLPRRTMEEPMLSRSVVSLAHMLFTQARADGMLTVSARDVEAAQQELRISVSGKLEKDLRVELNELIHEANARGRVFSDSDIVQYFHRLVPSAQPKHLRLFLVWIQEMEKDLEEESEATDLKAAAEVFRKNQARPLLPDAERLLLEQQFDKLDRTCDGLITVDEIIAGWELSKEDAEETFSGFDASRDSYIDKDEFIRIMCPQRYRPPDMTGVARDALGRVLVAAVAGAGGVVGVTAPAAPAGPVAAPKTVFPIATAEEMEQFNDLFNELDRNHDDNVDVRELECSGILSTSVCYAMAKIIDPKDQGGFSRDGFLVAMCHAHGRKPPSDLFVAEFESMQK
eukprot:NODE_10144_length_1374_cov_2.736167.p1 GENE.NODE_10144_length_1374_cov_2.736167~~NODE_10144_length_1374_cov_2.736167.p1  ORF type:complete len:359 (+),score=66.46 NODE_10144_length_1374_cov_2.736167:164-1240(+)